ncbi:hypothetical protein D3C85_1673170 [compost metagenome]
MWSAKLHHKQFDPFAHDHEPSEEDPYVATDEEGQLSLVNPKNLDLVSARKWVREHYRSRK